MDAALTGGAGGACDDTEGEGVTYPRSIPALAGKLAGEAYLTGVNDAQSNLAEPLVRLVLFADKHHDFGRDGCGLTPGVDPCASWCEACEVLEHVPVDMRAAIRGWR